MCSGLTGGGLHSKSLLILHTNVVSGLVHGDVSLGGWIYSFLIKSRITTNNKTRDIDIDSTPSTNIYTVVNISDIGRPRKGDIAYFSSVGKFKGYVSLGSETSWQDLN